MHLTTRTVESTNNVVATFTPTWFGVHNMHVHKACNPPFHQLCAAKTAVCLQGDKLLPFQKHLPSLPSNAQYMFHDNMCFDWGTFGWVLSSTTLDVSIYNYIVFMNSSVRGPFLPAYWPVSLPNISIRPVAALSPLKFYLSTTSLSTNAYAAILLPHHMWWAHIKQAGIQQDIIDPADLLAELCTLDEHIDIPPGRQGKASGLNH